MRPRVVARYVERIRQAVARRYPDFDALPLEQRELAIEAEASFLILMAMPYESRPLTDDESAEIHRQLLTSCWR